MSVQPSQPDDLDRLLADLWRSDLAALLKDDLAERRKATGGAVGGLTGRVGRAVDRLFKLPGRPFSRSLGVLGATVGATLPDAWKTIIDAHRALGSAARKLIEKHVLAATDRLPEERTLRLFGLTPRATREELHQAWRRVAAAWHPDRAPDEAERVRYHYRFVAYQAAYDRLKLAYDKGRLPRE